MKLFGALAVVAGCGLIGLVRAMALSRRERCLSAVIDSLQYMISELKTQALPLPELIAQLSKAAVAEARKYYVNLSEAMALLGDESFESLWTGAVMTDKALDLSEEQRRIVAGAGAFMGKFSAEEQTRALDGCIARLEPERRAAREKAREGKRLFPGLGLTIGIMLAAVFF